MLYDLIKFERYHLLCLFDSIMSSSKSYVTEYSKKKIIMFIANYINNIHDVQSFSF